MPRRHRRLSFNRGRANILEQVSPLWIRLLDQLDLPLSIPTLQIRLALYRQLDLFEFFKPDELVQIVSRSECSADQLLMFGRPSHEIGGHANVERSARFVGHHINVGGIEIHLVLE